MKPVLLIVEEALKPIEIVASYATFANKGIYSTPIAITRIEDKYGRIIKEYSFKWLGKF